MACLLFGTFEVDPFSTVKRARGHTCVESKRIHNIEPRSFVWSSQHIENDSTWFWWMRFRWRLVRWELEDANAQLLLLKSDRMVKMSV